MRTRGSAIVSALAVTALVSLLLGGTATFVISHVNRAQREKDYASALLVAEAGINRELAYISKHMHGAGFQAHTPTNPLNGTVPNVEGNFSAWIEPIGTDPWAPPKPMTVVATGTVAGITRKVSVIGMRQSIFAQYSVFGTNRVDMSGTGSLIEGNMGTNGVYSNSSSGSSGVDGDISYCGPYASGPSGNNTYTEPDPIEWPSVDTIVNATFPGGWDWLKSEAPINRSNGSLRQFRSPGGAMTPMGTMSANWPTTGSLAFRLSTPDVGKMNPGPDGIRTLIFVPGDYYFTNISLSGNVKLIMDTAGLTTGTPGQIRIWVGEGTPLNQDTLNCNVTYTSTDPRLFRFYYNKPTNLSISGNSTFHGGFYGVRDDGKASFTLSGGSIDIGSIISNTVTISGGSIVRFPMPGFEDASSDYSLWYGFADKWQEQKIQSTSKVFSDGTDN